MNSDEEHLRLLSIFHYVVGGMTALFACIPVVHLVLGLVMVFKPEVFGPGKDRPPEFLGWIMIGVAAVIILAGWTLAVLLVATGRCLAKRRYHTFCFITACLACLFMPLGTVLGVFTLIVLLRPSVKQMFQSARDDW